MQSQYLAQAPANSVPNHCISQSFFDAHSEAVSCQAVAPRENHEISRRPAPALAINRLIFRPPQKPPFAGQISLPQRLIQGLGFGHEKTKRGSARDALWRGAGPALCGHSWSSCVNGSRASYDAGERAVEKCASAKNPLLNKRARYEISRAAPRIAKTSVCETSSLCEVI